MSRFFWTAYDRRQFAACHLLELADITQIRTHNCYWPAGTTVEMIESALRRLFEAEGDKIALPAPGHCGPRLALYEFTLDNGMTVRIGVNSEGRVPLVQPLGGENVIKVSREEAQRLFTFLRAAQ